MWRRARAGTGGTSGDTVACATRTFADPFPAYAGSAGAQTAVAASSGPDTEDRLVALRRGLGEFRVSHSDSVLSATRVINPLLDLWTLAMAVGPSAAAPIEGLLTVLVARTSTTSAELGACADEVESTLT